MSSIDDETLALLKLSFCKGIGNRIIRALISEFGSAKDSLNAPGEDLKKISGVSDKLASTIQKGPEKEKFERELDLLERTNCQLLSFQSKQYPTELKQLDSGAPLLLWIRGDYVEQDRLAMALVGSRRSTHYGRTQARRFAMGLGEMGFTIVSGMARGIDSESHRAALQSGSRTIGLLGCGLGRLDSLHDPELALKVCENGALISELPMNAPPLPKHFPPRNRLISGLSLGVAVIEARKQSGSLITARHAGEQGKAVFAVPGNVTSKSSSGCHKLIRDGVSLVESPKDITEELGPLSKPIEIPGNGKKTSETDKKASVKDPRSLSLNKREKQIFDLLSYSPTQIDSLTEKTGLPSSTISSTLMTLEIRGLVKKLPGQNYVRT